MTPERKKIVDKLRKLLKQDPELFLSALVNTIDTVHERAEPDLIERRPQVEREALIVDYISRHF